MPEVAKALDKMAKGGRLETGHETLKRARPPESPPRGGALSGPLREGRRRHGRLEPLLQPRVFPLKTVTGACGPAGAPVMAADVDRVLPKVIKNVWDEEVEDVLLVSQQASWPETPAVGFVA